MAPFVTQANLAKRAALVGLTACVFSACAATAAADSHTEFVYVGTLHQQINALRFDAATGKFVDVGIVAQGLKSTWVASHPHLPVLYAVNDDRDKEGSVTAYAVNRDTGSLERINDVLTGGRGTTFLHFDAPSSTLLGANYNSGSVSSLAVNRDGSVGALESTIAEKGSGPSPRQTDAHAHGVTIDPSGRYALVPDLGADRVFIYGFDRATHALTQLDEGAPRAFVMPAGSGPRRVVFGTTGQYAYVLTELSAELQVLRWDAATAQLTPLQTLPISRPGFEGVKSGAEMAMSRDGRFIYVEDRGENALVVYRVDGASGQLTELQRTPSGGDKPWGFAIDPSGKWLFVANQRSGNVSLFRIDPKDGTIADSEQSISIPAPTSIAFVK
ncbi:lactonase family protein [Paraburkholderia sp.]|uniref:lactonase family protein n=1 Tax=Paraburkholderia sp. TaxID=1926495 RepID=UPI00286F1CBA|nr:lactonase family protein [Paraburkholderia sp.]